MPGFARLYALVAVAVLALWLGLLLLGQQARQQRSEHIQALREAYVLRNLRTAAESYLATGLQLPQLEVLQGVVERERQNFAGVMAIDIFSAQGRVLFSTDLGNRGLQVPSAWRELLASDAVWLQTQPGQRQIGQRFEGELGQAVGIVEVAPVDDQRPAQPAQDDEQDVIHASRSRPRLAQRATSASAAASR